jgi:hypothetical protein
MIASSPGCSLLLWLARAPCDGCCGIESVRPRDGLLRAPGLIVLVDSPQRRSRHVADELGNDVDDSIASRLVRHTVAASQTSKWAIYLVSIVNSCIISRSREPIWLI